MTAYNTLVDHGSQVPRSKGVPVYVSSKGPGKTAQMQQSIDCLPIG